MPRTISQEFENQYKRCTTDCIDHPATNFNRNYVQGNSSRPYLEFNPAAVDFKVQVGREAERQSKADTTAEAYMSGPMIGTWFVDSSTKKYQIYTDIVKDGQEIIRSENRAAVRDRASILVDDTGKVKFTYGENKHPQQQTKFFMGGLHSLFNYMEEAPEQYKGGYARGGKQTMRYNMPIARAYYAQDKEGNMIFGMTKDGVSPKELKKQLTAEGFVAAYLPDHGSVSALYDRGTNTDHRPARTTPLYITIGVGAAQVQDPDSAVSTGSAIEVETPEIDSVISGGEVSIETQTNLQKAKSFANEIYEYGLDIGSMAIGLAKENILNPAGDYLQENWDTIALGAAGVAALGATIYGVKKGYVGNVFTASKRAAGGAASNVASISSSLTNETISGVRASYMSVHNIANRAASATGTAAIATVQGLYKGGTRIVEGIHTAASAIGMGTSSIGRTLANGLATTYRGTASIVSTIGSSVMNASGRVLSKGTSLIAEGLGNTAGALHKLGTASFTGAKSIAKAVYQGASVFADQLRTGTTGLLKGVNFGSAVDSITNSLPSLRPNISLPSINLPNLSMPNIGMPNLSMPGIDFSNLFNKLHSFTSEIGNTVSNMTIGISDFFKRTKGAISSVNASQRNASQSILNRAEAARVNISSTVARRSADVAQNIVEGTGQQAEHLKRVSQQATTAAANSASNVVNSRALRKAGVVGGIFGLAFVAGAVTYGILKDSDSVSMSHTPIVSRRQTEPIDVSHTAEIVKQSAGGGIGGNNYKPRNLPSKPEPQPEIAYIEEDERKQRRNVTYKLKKTPETLVTKLGTTKVEGNFVTQQDIQVEDADTFILPGGKKLRLMGGDAPETSIVDKARELGIKKGTKEYQKFEKSERLSGDPENKKYKKISQFQGNEATSRARQLLNEGKGFYISEQGLDNYGRTLAEVYTADGQNISTILIREGLATTALPGDKYFTGTQTDFDNVEAMVEAYKEGVGIWSNPDAVSPHTFRKQGPNTAGIFKINRLPTLQDKMENFIKREGYRSQGLFNNQYGQVLADEDLYFTLPAAIGASAHYGRSLNNSLMAQAGYMNLVHDGGTVGMAETMMEYNNQMLGKEPLGNFEKFVARAYDTGLYAPGLGMYLNQKVFMPMGWGRVYKDEKGALPSILGLAGRVLDESYLYYAHMDPDYKLIGQDYQAGLGYGAHDRIQNGQGVFQETFENIGEFGVSMAQSLGMYVAFAQPIDMFKAEIFRNFLDSTLTDTIAFHTHVGNAAIENAESLKNLTGFNKLTKPALAAEWFFGDLTMYNAEKGGLGAAVLKQRFWLDKQPTGQRAFFDYKYATTSNPFLLQQMVERGRAASLIDSTFKPFLLEFVNPYDQSTELGRQSFDDFSRAINEFIEEVAKPPDLHLKFRNGESLTFHSFDYNAATNEVVSRKLSLADNPEANIKNYTQLKEAHEIATKKVSSNLSRATEELAAERTRLARSGTQLKDLSPNARYFALEKEVQGYQSAMGKLDDQLGKAYSKMEVQVQGVGAERKLKLTSKLQNILNMLPLNPLKWGVFSQAGIQTASDTTMFGNLFSFKKSAEFVKNLLQGETETSRIFKSLAPIEGNVMRSVDDLGQAIWRGITGAFQRRENIKAVIDSTKEFRAAERKVQSAAQKKAQAATKQARRLDPDAPIVKTKGITFIANDQIAAEAAQLRGSVIAEGEVDDLIRAVSKYEDTVTLKGGVLGDAYDQLMDTAGVRNAVGELAEATQSFNKAIGITDGLGKSTGYVAATLFAAIALNNLMQSTSGTSIATQLSMAVFGEDEDIAIKFQGNRFLPTEMLAEAMGLGPGGAMAMNAAFDIATTGTIVFASHNLAKLSNGVGATRYTFTQATISELTTGDNPRYVLKAIENATDNIDVASTDFQKGAKYVLEETDKVTKKVISRMSLSVDAAGSFKTGRIAQEIATNVGTRTLIFATIGLVAVNAMRESAATFLNATLQSKESHTYSSIIFGSTAAGIGAGLIIDGASQVGKSNFIAKGIAGLGRQLPILQKMSKTKALGIAGLALGVGASALRLVFDDDINTAQKSLDPIVAGIVVGAGTAILTSSLAMGGAAGLAAMGAMAAINWAGIKFLKVGSQSSEVDEEQIRMASTLGRFSAAVLENEKDLNAHTLAVAAWAAQQGERQNIYAAKPSLGDEVISVARQSPLPFMQFFVNERITGVDKQGNNLTNVTRPGLARTYSVGVQSGPLFGTSISVELPVMYTPKQGFMGLSYNPDNNLMGLTNFLVNSTVWAGLALGAASGTLNFYSGMFRMADKFGLGGALTSQKMLAASKDLWNIQKFIYSSAEKINYMFTKTITSTMQALYGTDIELGIKVWKNTQAAYSEAMQYAGKSAAEKAAMSPLQQASGRMAAAENGLDKGQDALARRGSTLLGKNIARYGGAFILGAIVGASVADFGFEAYKHFRLQSSIDGGSSEAEIELEEAQLDAIKTGVVTGGGVALGLLNAARMAPRDIAKGLVNKVSGSISPGVKRRVGAVSRQAGKMLGYTRKVQTAVAQSAPGQMISSFSKSAMANPIVRRFIPSKLGLGVFAALFAFNIVKTSSEFGLARFMDRHVVYDENGPVYDNYEQKTERNIAHHLAVAGTLTTIQIAPVRLFTNVFDNPSTDLLKYAKDQEAISNARGTKSLLDIVGGNPVTRYRRYQRAIQADRLLAKLDGLSYEANEYNTLKKGFVEAGGAIEDFQAPEHLRKIEGAIRLREELGGKGDIAEYRKLKRILAMEVEERAGQLNAMGKTFDEADDVVKQFESRLAKHLGENGGEVAKAFSKIRGQTAGRFASKVFAAYTVLQLGKLAIQKIGSLGGEIGEDSLLDRLYKISNRGGKFGQRRMDGTNASIADGVFSVIADVARIVSDRDITNVDQVVSFGNEKWMMVSGQRLVGTAKDARNAQQAARNLSEMLIFDNPNAYIPMLNFGGKTLRRGERGVTTTSYFQLQGTGQDISAASYSMAAKFIFSQYVGGKGQMAALISQAARGMKGGQDLDEVGVMLRNTTSQLHALKTSRKYSRGTSEVNATLQGDALAAMIIEARQKRLQEIGWQPVDSLFSNMFWETQDKAKTQMGQRNYVKFLSNMAKGDRDVLSIFADLMGTDLFGNLMRQSSVKNIIFFSKDFKKGPSKNSAGAKVADLASMWHRTDTIGVQLEMAEQQKSQFFAPIMRNIIKPIASSGPFQFVPGWLKNFGYIAGSIFATAWTGQQLAALARPKEVGELLTNISERFTKMAQGNGIKVSFNNPNAILEGFKNRMKNTEFTLDSKWGATGRGQGQILTINQGGNSKMYLGLTDLGMSPGQNMFIDFGEVLDYMNEDQLSQYLKQVESHGNEVKKMFQGLSLNGEVAGIQSLLLGKNSVAKSVEANLDSVRKAHKVAGATMSELLENAGESAEKVRIAVINNATKEFADVVDQAVDKIFNSKALTEVVYIDILGDGEPRPFYVHELMEHGHDVEKLKTISKDTTTSFEARKDFNKQNIKDAVRKEAEGAIKEEYNKAQWSKSGNVIDDVATASEANARALNTITQDGSQLGAVRRSAGEFLHLEEVGTTEARRQAAKMSAKKAKSSVAHKTGGVIEMAIDDAQDALQFQRATHTIDPLTSQLGKGVGAGMNAVFTLGDIVQGVDIYSAYARVGEAYTSPYATSLDKDLAARELGRAFMSNMLGLAIGYGFGKLTGGLMGKVSEMQKNGTLVRNLGVGGLALGAGAVAVSALWKGAIEPAGRAMGKHVEESGVLSSIKGAFDNAWYTSSDFSGRALAAPIGWAANAGAPPAVLHGMSHGMGAAAGSLFIMGGLALSGIITIGLLPALAVAAGIGAVVGLGAMLFGDQMTDTSTRFIRDVKNIPYVGGIIGGTVTEPYRQIRNQERFKHHFHNSPFLQGYIGDIINSQWLNAVGAAEDPTGRDMVSFMFGEILYPADYDTSAWRKNAADSMIGGPPPLVDAVIANELKIRGEFYSDTVIGRYSWDNIVEHADNNNVIRSMEAEHRGERAAQIDKAYAQAKLAIMQQGGPQVALNAGSARKAAVTQQQIANIEKFQHALKAENARGGAGQQVTGVTVAAHKSNVRNSNDDQAESVKAMSLGVNTVASAAPLHLAHQYSQRVYVDDNILSVALEKGVHDSNPMLQADAKAFTGDASSKTNSPEIKDSVESYNAYKDKA